MDYIIYLYKTNKIIPRNINFYLPALKPFSNNPESGVILFFKELAENKDYALFTELLTLAGFDANDFDFFCNLMVKQHFPLNRIPQVKSEAFKVRKQLKNTCALLATKQIKEVTLGGVNISFSEYKNLLGVE